MFSNPKKRSWKFKGTEAKSKERRFDSLQDLSAVLGREKPSLLHNPKIEGSGQPVFPRRLPDADPKRKEFSGWEDVWALTSRSGEVFGFVDGELPLRATIVYA